MRDPDDSTDPDGERRRRRGVRASSAEFRRYDQVDKPDYRLAEAADPPERFADDFEFTVCDLGRSLRGDAGDRRRFADELAGALHEVGFAILVGHGVAPALFDAADGWVEELFADTTLADKLRFRAVRHGAVNEGYFPIRETSAIHPDLVEGWVFGRRAFDLDEGHAFDPAPFWPEPAFEPRFRRLVHAGAALFRPILHSALAGIGCDPHALDASLARPHLALRLNYYPPLERGDDRDGEASRLLGHEDVDLITLLPAPAVEGLQVLLRDGRWARLQAPRGSYVLNVGDYLQRLTNDLLRSTTHRVGRPRDPRLCAAVRTSTPLAAYLPPDDVLTVLPGTGAPKYEPIRVITFHTRTTAKFYGDDYAVEQPTRDEP